MTSAFIGCLLGAISAGLILVSLRQPMAGFGYALGGVVNIGLLAAKFYGIW